MHSSVEPDSSRIGEPLENYRLMQVRKMDNGYTILNQWGILLDKLWKEKKIC